MEEKMLLVAIGCSRLSEIMKIAAENPVVIFGTMDGSAFFDRKGLVEGDLTPGPSVYFYETG